MRHMADGHIASRLVKSAAAVEVISADSLLDRIVRFSRQAEEILADARAGGQHGVALAAIARLGELLKIEGMAMAQVRAEKTGCPTCRMRGELEVDEETAKKMAQFFLRTRTASVEDLRAEDAALQKQLRELIGCSCPPCPHFDAPFQDSRQAEVPVLLLPVPAAIEGEEGSEDVPAESAPPAAPAEARHAAQPEEADDVASMREFLDGLLPGAPPRGWGR